MSLHTGTKAETERKKLLEAFGHVILNLGQNQYGDLEDVCCNVIIEVKTSKDHRRDLKPKEKVQLKRLLDLAKWRKIRYDIRFSGNGHSKPQWIQFYPAKPVSSFKLPMNKTNKDETPSKINSKRAENNNKKPRAGKSQEN